MVKVKTWEMIKELTENPEKEFVQKYNKKLHVFMTVDGEVFYGIDGDGQTKPLVLDNWLKQEWEEVKEPVTFIDALRSDKKVMIKHQDLDGELRYMSETYNDIDDVMYNISSYFTAEGVREILLNGEWYIED